MSDCICGEINARHCQVHNEPAVEGMASIGTCDTEDCPLHIVSDNHLEVAAWLEDHRERTGHLG